MRKIRWTITGAGGPMDTRREVWNGLSDLVSEAETQGLRVEVVEVEEESDVQA